MNDFLVFSEGIKWEQWSKMSSCYTFHKTNWMHFVCKKLLVWETKVLNFKSTINLISQQAL